MSRVLVLTGTCGSGKATIAGLLAQSAGWTRISEDEIWMERYGETAEATMLRLVEGPFPGAGLEPARVREESGSNERSLE